MIPIYILHDTYFDMKKEEKKQKLREFSDYIEQGIIEVGKESNMDIEVTNIVKARQGKMPDSVFVLQSFAQKLAFQQHYTAYTHRVLFYFISVSQYENFISVDIKTISEDLNISLPSVKRATKQLCDDNIIMKVAHVNDKRRIDYFINPMAMWKGKTITRDKFLNKAKDNRMQLDLFK